MSILIKSFFIGFFGDLILQIIVKIRGNYGGLNDYFQIHGPLESMMIGAGIMFILTYIYQLLKLPFKPIPLFLFGAIADVIWRQLNLMPTLKNTYYKILTPIESAFWGGFANLLLILFY